jgi:hypothetical protein
MKGKLLQKTTALMLVLCMTMVNFLFVATNIVYAVSGSEVSVESGKVKFDAYFKDANGNKTYTKDANISEGATLYAKIKLVSGILKDGAKITINNANFRLPEVVNNQYVAGVNNATKEIVLRELNGSYVNDIELEIPVKFEKQSTISVDYFNMDNSIVLSGEYKASETFKAIEAKINTHLNWKEDKDNGKAGLPTTSYKQEKAIKDGNKVLVQEKITVNGGLLPRTEDKLYVTIPKINDKEPDTVNLLVNGSKVDVGPNNITTGATPVFEYTNTFLKDKTINWGTGTDVYTLIYIYEDVENIDSVKTVTRDIQTAQVKLAVLNTTLKDDTVKLPRAEKGPMSIQFTTGHIVSASAESASKSTYKGLMYANSSNGTPYTEKYNMEVSDTTGVTSMKLELSKDQFKHLEVDENNKIKSTFDQDTNNQTKYTKIKFDWNNVTKVLGSDGTITIRDDDGNVKEINSSSEKEVTLNTHNITITTSKPVNEGTIEITAEKLIIGDAGLDKDTIQKINAIVTEIKVTTNNDTKGSTSEAITELKEPTTKPATLALTSGYIFSTKNVNDVEFQVKLPTGTPDTYLFKEPTITLELPEDVSEISNVSAKALFADKNELQVEQSDITAEGNKIEIKIKGEQTMFDNQTVGGIVVTVNAKVAVKANVPEGTELPVAKAAKVTMSYTNENAATQPEPVSTDVIIDIQKQAQTTEPTQQNPTQEPTNQDPTLVEETPRELGPAVEETTDKIKVAMTAVSAGVTLKDGDQVNAGQAVTYTYKITNISGQKLNNVKVVLSYEGANVFGEYTYQDMDSFSTDNQRDFTILTEIETPKEITIPVLDKNQTTDEIITQVVVKKDAQKLTSKLEIKADEIEKQTFTMENKVNAGKIKASLVNNINRLHPLVYGNYPYNTLKIENLTESTIKNAVVTMTLPEELELVEIDNSSNVVIENTSNKNNIKLTIKELDKIEEIGVKARVVKNTDSNIVLKYKVQLGENETYYSNTMELLTEKLTASDVKISQTSNIKEDTVKNGDKLVYTFVIKNNENTVKIIDFTDTVPETAVVNKVTYTINNKDTEFDDITVNTIRRTLELNGGEEATIKIETEVDVDKATEETLANKATIKGNYFNASSNSIEYKIQKKIKPEETQEDPQQGENPTTEPTIPGIVTTKNSISGMAWVDTNKNGIRESSEKPFVGITAMLVNTKTNKFVTDENGNRISVKTNSNGMYSFENIEEGSYMVVFTYDNLKYRNTEYQVASASETTNSDIITGTISTDGNSKIYAMTDKLVLKDKSIQNIDAGFIENEVFDLKINKYISKVTIQNTAGTVVKQYNKQQLAKVEIDAKLLASSTVLVEYTLEITNEGELAGYANEIVDYMPKDMSFNSEINKNWYKSTDGNVHTTALSKEIIQPGETKQVVLTLTKAMTENNTGVTTNKAEIARTSNELSIPDKDTADNISSAELIVSIRTGVEVSIGIIIAIIVLTTTGIIVYTKKRKEANHE